MIETELLAANSYSTMGINSGNASTLLTPKGDLVYSLLFDLQLKSFLDTGQDCGLVCDLIMTKKLRTH